MTIALKIRLEQAREARDRASEAQEVERVAVSRFIGEARTAGWSWARIGSVLGISDTAVRAYYTRNNSERVT
jgi:hypothetical protein